MTITIDRKRKESIEVFPKIEDFIKYLKKEYNNINFNDEIIKSSIYRIYEKLIKDDGNVRYLRMTRWLPKQFGFKHSNKFSLPFWLERGFSEKSYKKYSKPIFEKRAKRITKYAKGLKKSLYVYDKNYSNLYKFNTIEFKLNKKPNCNLCNHELVLKKSKSNDKKFFIIEGCSNKKCDSKDVSNKKLRWCAFLPKEKQKEIEKNLKDVKRSFSKEFWIKKGYSKKEAIDKVSKIQSENSNKFKGKRTGKSKDILRKKGYTEEMIKEACLSTLNVEFWIKKGYSKEKSIEIISEKQKKACKFVDYNKRLLPSNIKYWTKKGHSEKEAKKLVSKSQTTFSKEICIEKWGYDKGIKIFNKRQNKWQKSLYKNGNIKGGYSKVSQELFFEISKKVNGKFKFAKNNGEFCIRESKNYYYDFLDINRKKIIEYNGDRYHANPKIYEANDYPHPYHKGKGLKSTDIWKKDKKKIQKAIDKGFDVLVVWDSEYKKNKESVIKKCINFLLEK